MMKTKRLSPVAVTSIVLGVIVAICLILALVPITRWPSRIKLLKPNGARLKM